MPTPTSNVTLRPDLAGALEEFDRVANRARFIGLLLFPVFEAAKPSGEFGRIPVKELLKKRKTERAPKSAYGRGNWNFEDDDYKTKERGWEEPVDDTEAELYREYFDSEVIATETVRDVLLRQQEDRIASLSLDTTKVPHAAKSGGVYTDPNSATPIADFEAAWKEIRDTCGIEPDTAVISRPTFRLIRSCDEFLDRVKFNGLTDVKPANVTPQIMAQMFDIRQVLVPGGVQNLADESLDAAFSDIWDPNKILACSVATTNNIKEPCFGRTFHWAKDGSSIGITVEEYREEQSRGNVIRGRHHVGEKLMYPETGFIITGVNPAA